MCFFWRGSSTVSDFGHRDRALKASAYARVDTVDLAPGRVADFHEPVREVARELLHALLHDRRLREGGDLRHFPVRAL